RSTWQLKPGRRKRQSSVFWHVLGRCSSAGGTMTDMPEQDDFFERLASQAEPVGHAPAELKGRLYSALTEENFFAQLGSEVENAPSPSRLKSRIYSALISKQAESDPLLDLSEIKANGRKLCVFERLVEISAAGERARKFNYCRICHARVLAERM